MNKRKSQEQICDETSKKVKVTNQYSICTYNDQGKLATTTQYIRNKKHGICFNFKYCDDPLIQEAQVINMSTWQNNEKHGVEKTFIDGTLWIELQWYYGRISVDRKYWPNSSIKSEFIYHNNSKTIGYWLTYYENGKIENNRKYYPNGSVERESYFDEDGNFTSYSEYTQDGNLRLHEHTSKDILLVEEYNKNSNLIKLYERNKTTRENIRKTTYKYINGTQLIESEFFVDKFGTTTDTTYWLLSGNIRSVIVKDENNKLIKLESYRKNQLREKYTWSAEHGSETLSYYSNGTLQLEQRNNTEDTFSVLYTYFQDGQQKSAEYYDDSTNNIIEQWYQNGQLRMKEVYTRLNQQVSSEHYCQDGNLVNDADTDSTYNCSSSDEDVDEPISEKKASSGWFF